MFVHKAKLVRLIDRALVVGVGDTEIRAEIKDRALDVTIGDSAQKISELKPLVERYFSIPKAGFLILRIDSSREFAIFCFDVPRHIPITVA